MVKFHKSSDEQGETFTTFPGRLNCKKTFFVDQ